MTKVARDVGIVPTSALLAGNLVALTAPVVMASVSTRPVDSVFAVAAVFFAVAAVVVVLLTLALEVPLLRRMSRGRRTRLEVVGMVAIAGVSLGIPGAIAGGVIASIAPVSAPPAVGLWMGLAFGAAVTGGIGVWVAVIGLLSAWLLATSRVATGIALAIVTAAALSAIPALLL